MKNENNQNPFTNRDDHGLDRGAGTTSQVPRRVKIAECQKCHRAIVASNNDGTRIADAFTRAEKLGCEIKYLEPGEWPGFCECMKMRSVLWPS